MQHTDQGEQSPCRGFVGFDFAHQAFLHQNPAFVVDAATAHVDGLNLGGGMDFTASK
jgi:hypothetical protein